MSRRGKKNLVQALICLVLFLIMFFFFSNNNFFETWQDVKVHYQIALELSKMTSVSFEELAKEVTCPWILSYPGWHLLVLFFDTIIRLCAGVSSGQIAVGIVSSLCVVGTYIGYCIFFERFLGEKRKKIWIFVCAMGLIFSGPLYCKIINSTYYLGQLTINPWHNPTYVAVKPFGIFCFFLFSLLLSNREKIDKKNEENKKFIQFSIVLFLSAFFKPSFYQIFIPALFVYCIILFFVTKFKAFDFCIKTALAIIPTCILALIQYGISFGGGEGIGIDFFKVWTLFSNNIIGSILLSILFPVYVYLLCWKQVKKSAIAKFSAVCFFSGFLQFISFYQKEKMQAGDFLWGAFLALLIFSIAACVMLNRYYNEKGFTIGGIIAIVIGGAHVFCGLIYFTKVFQTGNYLMELF